MRVALHENQRSKLGSVGSIMYVIQQVSVINSYMIDIVITSSKNALLRAATCFTHLHI